MKDDLLMLWQMKINHLYKELQGGRSMMLFFGAYFDGIMLSFQSSVHMYIASQFNVLNYEKKEECTKKTSMIDRQPCK